MTYSIMFQDFIFTKNNYVSLKTKRTVLFSLILCVNSLLKRNAVTALLLNPCSAKTNPLIC